MKQSSVRGLLEAGRGARVRHLTWSARFKPSRSRGFMQCEVLDCCYAFESRGGGQGSRGAVQESRGGFEVFVSSRKIARPGFANAGLAS
ncbi:hypothetical protein J5N97_027602 [Dioscorea zingiberensis]|uniref:Uncharacterized protein n=1 Tax=Dioscorea zingiberensis TaxID=325984 RepID=A0A9D5C5N0_9LILI|nr:hypothetical protein J5N97_027602 [Dioscorea zingiberensis]